MRPLIENVITDNAFNWMVKKYECRVTLEQFTCSWHYHSEYELVLYRDPHRVFSGRFFAGDKVGDVTHNTLLLYGPGLPHMITGSLSGHDEHEHHSTILWFRQAWLTQLQQNMPELRILRKLEQRAAFGLQYSDAVAEQIFVLLDGIESLPSHHQLTRVLQALIVLAEAQETDTLSVHAYSQRHECDEAGKRVEQARAFVEKNYTASIKISDLCRALHISESSAYRLFERHFLESFSDHVKRYRVGKACELLVNSQLPVAIIAERTGFNNLSNFNRQFKLVKAMTPSDFRAQYK
uniref:helix-turn-helix domain-containing protein n=1 Tax=Thaumasiovibrio occultus TaxID=1891184 RepID=UPI000B3504A5|nr:AraC family transcriptional regulator [Thaumasiovibrio occultus]